jgi:hypothetical protein
MKCPQTLWRRSILVATVGVSLAASLAFAGAADAATTPSGSFSPPTSGSVAAISGSSMEVRNQQSGQVTVNWTPSTTFSQVASVPSSSAAAGDCVTVSGSSSKGTITAKTVTISQPTAGKCNSGGSGGSGGFGGGARPGGASGRPAGGFPGGRPGGATGGRRPGFGGSGNVGFASGTVKSATSTSLVISGISSASITKNAKSSKKPATPKTATVKVKTTSSTTYSENQAAASTNLAVGDCVTAAGSSDSTGAVSATTVRITSTGGQTCTTGFGRGALGG